ncbi:endolytic transglycosylase MltG [Patescibacteria group bacterium]|nr:endolytic transglycosylase MltG [Patescibacteria group bacterium]
MKKVFFAFLLLVVLMFAFFVFNLRPPESDSPTTLFVVNQGDSLSLIASRLEKQGFIRQKYVFIVYSYYLNLNKKLQSGGFQLSPSMSVADIIQTLSSGGSHDSWVKILPGWRLSQATTSIPDNLAFSSSDLLASSFLKEGYLFPDSYLIPEYYTVDQFLALVSQNFTKNFAKAQEGSDSKLSDSEILILASLLEREARTLINKKIVAGILLNRLDIDMALQVDATVQYARDSLHPPDKYWQPPSRADLQINSVFNTYKNRGLPPTPICNPGLDSLIAAFHPSPSDYLYYISDNSGQMHYAKTLEEHNQHIADYLR